MRVDGACCLVAADCFLRDANSCAVHQDTFPPVRRTRGYERFCGNRFLRDVAIAKDTAYFVREHFTRLAVHVEDRNFAARPGQSLSSRRAEARGAARYGGSDMRAK